MQIQFHVSDLNRNFKGNRKKWAKEYLKYFVRQAKKQAKNMIEKFVKPVKPFDKYIKCLKDINNLNLNKDFFTIHPPSHKNVKNNHT